VVLIEFPSLDRALACHNTPSSRRWAPSSATRVPSKAQP